MPAEKEKIFKGLRSNFGDPARKGELELRDNKLIAGKKGKKKIDD